MKNKHILIALLLGISFTTLGSYLKITHQNLFGTISGHNLLSFGLLLELIAVIMLIIKLLKNKKTNSFLNK